MNWAEEFMVAVGFVNLIAITLGVCAWAMNRWHYRNAAKGWNVERERLLASMAGAVRWCSHEFPIVEDLCDHFFDELKAKDGSRRLTDDQLREKLRSKYVKSN